MDHIYKGPSVLSGTLENDTNVVVDEGPFPSSSIPRRNVDLDGERRCSV